MGWRGTDWIGVAQDAGWDVLLDIAAYCPTNRLDLKHRSPEFLVCSFYKSVFNLALLQPGWSNVLNPHFGFPNVHCALQQLGDAVTCNHILT